MVDYFKPLRRKLGLGTLVLACVFAAIWTRSLFMSDSVFYPANSQLPPRYDDASVRDQDGNDMTVGVWSCDGCLAIEYALDAVVSVTMFDFGEPWFVHRLGFGHPGIAQFQQCDGEWVWRSCGFGKVESRNSLMFTTVWLFPYWSVVLPLTLLSAWLLLSKSRPKLSDATTSP